MNSDPARRLRRPNPTHFLVVLIVVAGIAWLARAELLNYLYITRFLWQFLTGLPLSAPLLPLGADRLGG